MNTANRVHLSILQIGLAFLMVFSSWFVFWSPYYTPINLILAVGFDVIMLVALIVLARFRPRWGVSVSRMGRWLFWGLAMLLVLASPLILYWSVTQATEHVLKETGIHAERVSYQLRLIDNLQIGESPRRRIYATYQLTEPLDDAVKKIDVWANSKNPPWQTGQARYKRPLSSADNEIRAACDPGSPDTGGGIHSISIWSDGQMTMMIRFADTPQACGLPSNIFNRLIYSGWY